MTQAKEKDTMFAKGLKGLFVLLMTFLLASAGAVRADLPPNGFGLPSGVLLEVEEVSSQQRFNVWTFDQIRESHFWSIGTGRVGYDNIWFMVSSGPGHMDYNAPWDWNLPYAVFIAEENQPCTNPLVPKDLSPNTPINSCMHVSVTDMLDLRYNDWDFGRDIAGVYGRIDVSDIMILNRNFGITEEDPEWNDKFNLAQNSPVYPTQIIDESDLEVLTGSWRRDASLWYGYKYEGPHPTNCPSRINYEVQFSNTSGEDYVVWLEAWEDTSRQGLYERGLFLDVSAGWGGSTSLTTTFNPPEVVYLFVNTTENPGTPAPQWHDPLCVQ